MDSVPPQGDPVRARLILAVSASLLTVAVMATLVAVVLSSADDRHSGDIDGDVTLVAANIVDGEQFTRSILVAPIRISPESTTRSSELLEQVPIRADRGVRLVSGQQAELYGATGEVQPCDVVALANDLDANGATQRIWALALGLKPEQVPYYLNTLTAVVLMADTWVTVHSRGDGDTLAQQAVLQAGNAVLVDPLGVPRVRCASGSPLTPPVNAALNRYRVIGDAWDGFTPHTVVAVQYSITDGPAAPADLSLVDVTTGQQLTRKVGGSIDLGDSDIPLPDPTVMNVPPTAHPSGR